MFTKVEAIVPLYLPERTKDVASQITIDTDENVIEIKCFNTAATHELMDSIRRGAIRIKIEEVD
jgi:hypothetical protein